MAKMMTNAVPLGGMNEAPRQRRIRKGPVTSTPPVPERAAAVRMRRRRRMAANQTPRTPRRVGRRQMPGLSVAKPVMAKRRMARRLDPSSVVRRGEMKSRVRRSIFYKGKRVF